jgi:hypothetical protein
MLLTNMEKILLNYMNNGENPNGEEAVLKTVGCKSLGGSTPSLSAKGGQLPPFLF